MNQAEYNKTTCKAKSISSFPHPLVPMHQYQKGDRNPDDCAWVPIRVFRPSLLWVADSRDQDHLDRKGTSSDLWLLACQ